MLSRHGSRYPTTGSNVATFGERVAEARKQASSLFRGHWGSMNKWKYDLGGLKSWCRRVSCIQDVSFLR